jgi:chromosome segregation ATPase
MYQGKKIISIRMARIFSLVVSLLCIGLATAAPKANDGSAAIKKAQGVIRQLTQEKAALEAEKTELLNQKTDQDNKIKSLEGNVKKLQPLQGEVERYKTTLENVRSSLESQLSQEKQHFQELLQKHNDVVTKAKAIRDDNGLLVQAVQEREKWITECGRRNRDLHKEYLGVLGKYKRKGLWQELTELDPLTGIGKVETETNVEDYKYRLQQLKLTPFQAQSGKDANPVASDTGAAP